MVSKLGTGITQDIASEDFEAVAARLPELQECIAQALAAAPDDAAREEILKDVLATHRRWLTLIRSLRAQAESHLLELNAEQHYLGAPDADRHIVQSVA